GIFHCRISSPPSPYPNTTDRLLGRHINKSLSMIHLLINS
ncbi:hypothetical protein I314_04121, partial [Cryptococcus bacillisporus CA1873]